MLHNSRTFLFPEKLKSKWLGPFKVTDMLENSMVEVEKHKGERFMTNGQRLIKYYRKLSSVRVVNVVYMDEV